MKQIVTLLILLIGLLWQSATAQTAPLEPCSLSDIDKDDDGLIEICDLEGLNAMRYQLDGTGYKASNGTAKITTGCPSSGCYGYELAKDLDFQDNSSYRDAATNKDAWTVSDYTDTADQGWEPIYIFSYVSTYFEGNDHTISNLMINRPADYHVGLFERVRSIRTEIINLGLLSVNVVGKNDVGGLAGANSGKIRGSYADGSVEGNDTVGGLIGINYGNIRGSHASGDVKGNSTTGRVSVGGLIGYNRGDISDSHASGDVKGGGDAVGGLIGFNESGDIINSYAESNVEGEEDVGGLIGHNGGNIRGSYADGDVKGDLGIGGLIGSNYSNIHGSYASGDVKGNNAYVGGLIGYNQRGDIRSSYASSYVRGNSAYVGGLIGFNESGDIINSYAEGSVEGGARLGGLTGHNGGNIRGSHASSDVKGNNNDAGGLIGINYGNIRSSYAEGSVEGDSSVGGLIGYNRSDISDSHASGDVKGNDYVGGLIGFHAPGKSILNSYSHSRVKGRVYVGGLVGYSSSRYSGIANSYVRGDVEGTRWVGGLAGLFGGLIANAYSQGSVKGVEWVGGLSGRLGLWGIVTNSYMLGDVEGSRGVGILVGTSANFVRPGDSYWDTTVSGIMHSRYGIGFSTEVLQTPTAPATSPNRPYYNWSKNDWDFGTNKQYPALKYTVGSDTNNPACGASVDLPNCDALLPGQRAGLVDLRLSKGAILSPIFDSELLNYRVISVVPLDQIQLIPIAVNSSATITVSSSGGFKEQVISATTSSAIALNSSATLITIQVAAKHDKTLQYTVSVNNHIFNEGEHIVLDGAALIGKDKHSLNYHWTQMAGPPLIATAGISQTILDIAIPATYISKIDTTADVTFKLEVSNAGVAIDREELSFTIQKIDNDFIASLAPPTVQGLTLIPSNIDLSMDADGSGTIDSYQWQRRTDHTIDWVDIAGATGSTYDIPATTASNTEYRLRLGYIDGQNYMHQLVSEKFTFKLDIDRDDNGLIEIDDLQGFNAMRYQLDGSGYRVSDAVAKIVTGCPRSGCNGYELVADLDFSDDTSYGDIVAQKKTWTSGSGWQPIGTYEHPFNSILRAHQHTISNLHINRAAADGVGLFGVSGDKAEIDGIGLLDMNVVGNDSVGGIVGHKIGGVVANSYASGRVQSATRVGGLVGDSDGLITQSYAITETTGDVEVGGLVGRNKGTIINSHVRGNVSGGVSVGSLVGWSSGDIVNSYADGHAEGNNVVGGLVGDNRRGTITNSYARGNVTGANQYIGGLVGWNGVGVISNSYAHGNVSGAEDVGGLVGVNLGQFNNASAGGVISKSYAVGKVTVTTDSGGLAGENRRGIITNSYWNKTNNPRQRSTGGTSKTTVEMQSAALPGSTATEIYYDWSSDHWDFASPHYYPLLKYAVGPDQNNPGCGDANNLPACDALLPGQLQPVTVTQLALSDGAILLPAFSPEVHNYRVKLLATTTHLRLRFLVSDAAGYIKITTDGGFADERASSGTRVPLNTDQATVVTMEVTAPYHIPIVYKFYVYVNSQPEIVLAGGATNMVIKEGREHAFKVRVSDVDNQDALTLLLSEMNEGQNNAALMTTNVAIATNGNALRDEQTLRIKGLKAGEVMLRLTVMDEDTVSDDVLLTVVVAANAPPTIGSLTDLRLLSETQTSIKVILDDADADDVDNLKANVQSSHDAIVTASIAGGGSATRTLTIESATTTGMAVLTVSVDDGRALPNSMSTQVFTVSVEENQAPVITIASISSRIIQLGSTGNIVVSVSDVNFDANDSVVLTAKSSTPSIISVTPTNVVKMTNDDAETFVLAAHQAGIATIEFSATDSKRAELSESMTITVNTPPMIVQNITTQVATIGQVFNLDLSDFFDDADGDVLRYEAHGLPNHIMLTPTGKLLGTPEPEAASIEIGGQEVRLSVFDDREGSVQTTFALLIDAETTGTVKINSDDPWRLKAITKVNDANGIAVINYQWYQQEAGNDTIVKMARETSAGYVILDDHKSRAEGTVYKIRIEIVDQIGRRVFLSTNHRVINAAPTIGTFMPMSVIEGEMVDAAGAVFDANYDPLNYSWRAWLIEADGEKELNIENTQTTIFAVATDWVDASVGAATLRVQLTVDDGTDSVSTMTSVIVIKKNNGVATSGMLIPEQAELRLPVIDLASDPDGGGTSATYVWQRCASDCLEASNWENIGSESDIPTVYTMTKNEVATRVHFRMKIVYRDGQGYEDTIFYHSDVKSSIRIRVKVFLESPL